MKTEKVSIPYGNGTISILAVATPQKDGNYKVLIAAENIDLGFPEPLERALESEYKGSKAIVTSYASYMKGCLVLRLLLNEPIRNPQRYLKSFSSKLRRFISEIECHVSMQTEVAPYYRPDPISDEEYLQLAQREGWLGDREDEFLN